MLFLDSYFPARRLEDKSVFLDRDLGVNGGVISVDEKLITVKLPDSSSKIVIVSETTQINKVEQVIRQDLKVGEKVVVFGQENSDGSLAAQNIQINPLRKSYFIKN